MQKVTYGTTLSRIWKIYSLQHMHFLLVLMIQANKKGDSFSRGTFKMVKCGLRSFSP